MRVRKFYLHGRLCGKTEVMKKVTELWSVEEYM